MAAQATNATVSSASAANATNTISADEIALYDRQIRLWGMQAQEKIRNAHILLVNIKALGNEVAKNLALAGIASLTLLDNALVTEDDLCSQFFLTEEHLGQNRAEAAAPAIRKLNPRVNVAIETFDIFNPEPTALARFSVIIATDLPFNAINVLNAASRLASIPFYAGGMHGLYGFVFADLIDHTFAIERTRSNITTPSGTSETPTRTLISVTPSARIDEGGRKLETVLKREVYQPLLLANTSPLAPSYLGNRRKLRSVSPLLPCLRALWDFEKNLGRGPSPNAPGDLAQFTTLATEKSRELQLPPELLKAEFLRAFLQNLYAEISPACAFLGGQLSQDVINVLSAREQPIQNLLLFDGDESKGEVYALYPMVTTADASL